MKKEIQYKDETIEISVELNIDHSEHSGPVHQVYLKIPTINQKKIYQYNQCDTSSIIITTNYLIEVGENIIDSSKRELDIEATLRKNGFL